jgi:dTDP-4-amino-4,6-dideoxygalactose transaminase
MQIPLVDLHAQYLTIKDEIDDAIARVISHSAFIGGEELRQFEKEFAKYCEAKACVGVGNGTDALLLARSAWRAIITAYTFIATAETISLAAQPVFVDVKADSVRFSQPRSRRERRAIICHLRSTV